MSNLFPFFGDIETKKEELPICTDVAWDLERNIPFLVDGQFQVVQGNQAVKSWCYRALQVKRCDLEIYSWNFGSELYQMIGNPYSKALAQAECARYVEECLLVSPYIQGISNIQSDFADGLLSLSCDISTIYGDESIERISIHD